MEVICSETWHMETVSEVSKVFVTDTVSINLYSSTLQVTQCRDKARQRKWETGQHGEQGNWEPGTGLCTPYLGIALFQITWRIRIVLLAIWEQRMIKLIRTAEYKAARSQLWDFLPPYCTDEQCCLCLLGVKKGQKMQWFNLLFNKVFLLLSACPMITVFISLS